MTSRLNWSRAIQAFCRHLIEDTCDHTQATLHSGKGFCRDCGQKVKLVWVQLRCQGCQSKRLITKTPLGSIEPVHRYCQHCGTAAVRTVKKADIAAHELIYSLGLKEIDYTDASPQKTAFHDIPRVHQFKPQHFRGEPAHVVEGHVVRKQYG